MASSNGLSARRALAQVVVTAAVGVIILSGCGGGAPEPGLTIETQLEAAFGRDLTPTEITRQIEIADTLCGMSDNVLAAIWDQLEEDQLAYQDFVFGSHCPDRSVTYGLATGRTLTPEARVAAAEQQTTEPSSTARLPQSTTRPRSTSDDTPSTSGGPTISIAADSDNDNDS